MTDSQSIIAECSTIKLTLTRARFTLSSHLERSASDGGLTGPISVTRTGVIPQDCLVFEITESISIHQSILYFAPSMT